MTELATIKFGTDGWRAVIARDFTFANVERVAQAYASYLTNSQSSKLSGIVVGYDRRFLSDQFALRAAEVLAGNGFAVSVFNDPQPTPLISWAVKQLNAAGGVVITASHNPAEFNGFKIKAPWGGSASPEMTTAVERLVDKSAPKRAELANTSSQHSAVSAQQDDQHLQMAIDTYREQIARYVDLDRLRKATRTVIVDPMHGAGADWVESFLQGGTLEVETIRANRDPLFGGSNPEPIDSNLGPLKQRVVQKHALVGLATDGDADRVGAVNELGETMTMHDVVPLILLHLVRNRKMPGGVVRTFSQSVLLKRIAAAYGLKLYETPIGFKYIADLMLHDDILIGAEESGGIGVKGHIPERDGILNSLLFLETVVTARKTPSELLTDLHREFGEFYFRRRDLRVDQRAGQALIKELSEQAPSEFAGFRVVGVEATDGTKLLFDDESWLLFRQSGTEPMLRIYSEATSVAKANALLDAAEQLAFQPVS